MPRTVLSLHAHPDDEVLLMGGTLARLSAEGHRVILAFATAGGAGLSDAATLSVEALAARRRAEAERAAAALGCSQVRFLGYDDSGMDGTGGREGRAFARCDVQLAARRVADLAEEVAADAVTGYDAAGGYGHPDHIRLHQVAARAAAIAGVPLMEATVDRTSLMRALRLLRTLRLSPTAWDADRFAGCYAARSAITHQIDVSGYVDRKRAAMAAHATQTGGGVDERTLSAFLRLPKPLFRMAFGHEWFVQPGRRAGRRPMADFFD